MKITLGDKLRKIRTSLGFTQKKLSELISIDTYDTRNFELGRVHYISPNDKRKILQFLDAHSGDLHVELDIFEGHHEAEHEKIASKNKSEHEDKSLDLPFAPKKRHFTKGKSYCIFDSAKGKGGDADYIFVYLRKDGKHHLFREARGGWFRTYTDVQLIGKHIQEV